MRIHFSVATVAIALLASACGERSDRREFTLQGQVLSVAADHKEATIKHEEITGFMAAMTMPYKARDAREFATLKPGDLIEATLVIVSNDGYLENVRKVGEAPLEQPAATAPSASSGFELLKEGEMVPDAAFVDQEGRKVSFESFRGSAVILTFIYTTCPMPTFCPLMDRNFAAIQKKVKTDHRGLNVRLLSVSFDPVTDTPQVMKAHAAKLEADPRIWSFLTGDRDEIDRFAMRFGVSVTRDMTDPRNIAHNLRTAIVDRQGRLVKVYTGNEWTPEEVLADTIMLVGVD
jgi:protein SCO1/2